MLLRWLPWRWIVRRAAQSYGLLDPASVLARVRKFAEPSEVHEPLEIVRAWVVFHARGVVNTRAIQHNLDWVWPYWVERQFDPRDPAFIPRAYTITHVNLTHRNWSAVALPELALYPLVDPRGLVTPLYDGWSLDLWVLGDNGSRLLPSRCDRAYQRYVSDEPLTIRTELAENGLSLASAVWLRWQGRTPVLHIQATARADPGGHIAVGLRPYNPEGVQFIDRVEPRLDGPGWRVNDQVDVRLDHRPERYMASTYEAGDVYHCLPNGEPAHGQHCEVGMVTAAAISRLAPGQTSSIGIEIPLPGSNTREPIQTRGWDAVRDREPDLQVPEPRFRQLFTDAARTLTLLSPHEVYPGPYVYQRFWYRDAAYILQALLVLNYTERCGRVIEDIFPRRQRATGFFESQEGEWDSNGEVLWIAERHMRLTGRAPRGALLDALERGARWLRHKRQLDPRRTRYPGLLPPGFSAEHLGPNNYFFWDNLWGVAGLRAAARLFQDTGRIDAANASARAAEALEAAIGQHIEDLPEARARGGIPAAPARRLDAGAIGSLVGDYPLQLFPPGDERVLRTADFLFRNCLINHGFFQDMTHSGINPYLTLHLAQVFLRAEDPRHWALICAVADLASPTGQWPEAIHPATGGGCMGDGQHGWSAAEWVLMMRALFLREEGEDLVLGAGLPLAWLNSGEDLGFGPTPTPYGSVSVSLHGPAEARRLTLEAHWRALPRRLLIRLPGHQPLAADPESGTWQLTRRRP